MKTRPQRPEVHSTARALNHRNNEYTTVENILSDQSIYYNLRTYAIRVEAIAVASHVQDIGDILGRKHYHKRAS